MIVFVVQGCCYFQAAQRELEKQEKGEEVSSGLPSGVGSGDATAMDTSSSSTAQDDDTSG